MNRAIVFVLMILSCASCTSSPGGAGDPGVLEVTGPCAVLFTPAGSKLQSLKSAFGEKSFPGISSLNRSAMVADSQYLAGKKVKIVSTSATQLRFVKKGGEVLDINLNHSKYAWEIFLFNGYSDPVKADLTDIEGSWQEAGIPDTNVK